MMTASTGRPHVDGTVLPFPPTPSGSVAGRTMQESVYSPQPTAPRLPDDAPNILIVLIDDAGPALPEVFGGEIHAPTLERLTSVVRAVFKSSDLPHFAHCAQCTGG